ncbi:MAG: hypothetical protein R3B06_31015 [Kofleriaceae bacterium]
MSVFRDPRTNKWRARKMVRRPDGTKVRIFALPEHYGLPDTRIGAEEAERRAIAAVVDAPASPPAAPAVEGRDQSRPLMPTVAEFTKTWLAKSEVDDKPSTIRKKQVVARAHILPRFGHLRLDEVDYSRVETWRLDLLQRQEPSSVHKLLSTLHSILGYAYAQTSSRASRSGRRNLHPRWSAELPLVRRDRSLDCCGVAVGSWRAMITVAVRTGLRHGELTALRWQDVDLDGRRLTVVENYVEGNTAGPPKSGHLRVIPGRGRGGGVAGYPAW